MAITRRTFLKRAALSGVTAAVVLSGTEKAAAQMSPHQEYATIINLTKCDGCSHLDTPACVSACRSKNQSRFPEPEKPIGDYWPQPFHEDWSDKQQIIDRLTPYNWTYVQHLEVEHQGRKVRVHIPRRCMHCDNPPCSGLCPFGVIDNTPEGAVVIDTDMCFGGAKCRDVCPWGIPQRQAGVGLYKKVAPKFAGGGVMYKCDMCIDLIQEGKEPACVAACPNQAITLGTKEEMRAYAHRWADENQGHIYGDLENGGTATFYLSQIPFENIDQAIKEQENDGKPGRPSMEVGINNPLDEPGNMAKAFAIAPVAGVLAAGLSVYKIMQGEEQHEDSEA